MFWCCFVFFSAPFIVLKIRLSVAVDCARKRKSRRRKIFSGFVLILRLITHSSECEYVVMHKRVSGSLAKIALIFHKQNNFFVFRYFFSLSTYFHPKFNMSVYFFLFLLTFFSKKKIISVIIVVCGIFFIWFLFVKEQQLNRNVPDIIIKFIKKYG